MKSGRKYRNIGKDRNYIRYKSYERTELGIRKDVRNYEKRIKKF